MEGDKWQLGGSRDKMELRSFQAAGMPSRTVLSVTISFHSPSIVTVASLPSSPHDQISTRRLAATRVWAGRFPSVHSQSRPRPCQDHRAPGRRLTAPVVSPEPTAVLLRQWDRYLLVPSAPSLLAIHLSSRPPPSFPRGFRGTRTRHAWMPGAGSSLCGEPTTAIPSSECTHVEPAGYPRVPGSAAGRVPVKTQGGSTGQCPSVSAPPPLVRV